MNKIDAIFRVTGWTALSFMIGAIIPAFLTGMALIYLDNHQHGFMDTAGYIFLIAIAGAVILGTLIGSPIAFYLYMKNRFQIWTWLKASVISTLVIIGTIVLIISPPFYNFGERLRFMVTPCILIMPVTVSASALCRYFLKKDYLKRNVNSQS